MYCTQDSIEDIMLVSSILDKSPAATKLNDPQNTWKHIKSINLRKFVIELNEPSHEVNIPIVSINKIRKIQKNKQKKLLSQALVSFQKTLGKMQEASNGLMRKQSNVK